jgi:hypothetical protein
MDITHAAIHGNRSATHRRDVEKTPSFFAAVTYCAIHSGGSDSRLPSTLTPRTLAGTISPHRPIAGCERIRGIVGGVRPRRVETYEAVVVGFKNIQKLVHQIGAEPIQVKQHHVGNWPAKYVFVEARVVVDLGGRVGQIFGAQLFGGFVVLSCQHPKVGLVE